jgi:hypothetical protein
MAVAGARTGDIGGLGLGGVAVRSDVEIAHQSVDCGPVFSRGWHVVVSARLLLVHVLEVVDG